MASKIKRLLLCSAAGLLYYTGMLSVRQFVRQRFLRKNEICVLGLHRILSDEQRQRANSLGGIVMREATFTRLLEFLDRHYSVVSLDGFLQSMRQPHGGPKPLCLITFDDGWRDNYLTALPCLRAFRMPAVIFVVTGFIGRNRIFWVERLRTIWQRRELREQIHSSLNRIGNFATPSTSFEEIVEHLKHMPAAQRDQILAEGLALPSGDSGCNGDAMLSWDEAALLQKEGVDIEAHTVSHPLLVYEDDPTVERELAQAKAILEEKLKKKVRAFAYPNGSWNQRVRDLVEVAGYDCAFTTERGWHRVGDDAYAIRRIMLHEEKLAGLDGQFSPAVAALRLTGWV